MTSIMTLPNYMTGFLHELGPSSGVYSFVSYPSAILPTNRAKYRNESATNIMHDRRVVRGNTYAQRIPLRSMNVTATTDTAEMRQREAERRAYVKRRVLPNIDGGRIRVTTATASHNGRASELGRHATNGETATPDARHLAARARARKRLTGLYSSSHGSLSGSGSTAPLDGRKHCQIQTEKWLEEIQDRLAESDVGVQTEREIWPPIVAPKQVPDAYGVDKSTQILPDDPDLFVFDEEVVVILETLVGKTLEQGLLEVIDEEELAAMTKQKLSFQHRAMMVQCT